MAEQVIVLGAGAGGAMTANRLDRSLAGAVDVTVLDRSAVHRYQPALYLDPFGYLDLATHERDVREYLRGDVRFHETVVTGVDPERRRVATDDGTVPYDRLVVALGHAVVHDRVDGLSVAPDDDVYPFYEPAGSRGLGTALDRACGDGTQREDPIRLLITEPSTAISCGGAGLKLALLAEDYLSRNGVDVEVTLAGPDDCVFGTGRKARYDELITDVLADRAVRYVGDFEVEAVDRDERRVHAADGRSLGYDWYAPVSPQQCPRALVDGSPLTRDRSEDPGQYVDVDPETLRHERYDRVYALGDCTDVPTSKTAAACRKQAAVVAHNLTVDVTDHGSDASYGGFAACPLLTERGKAVMAVYDYEGARAPAVESRLSWIVDLQLLPPLYWQVWLRGYGLRV